jgi:hypothetical protein
MAATPGLFPGQGNLKAQILDPTGFLMSNR